MGDRATRLDHQTGSLLPKLRHRLVVRNGYHRAREVLTAAGAVEVKAPRVKRRPRRPRHRCAPAVFLGSGAGLSASTITRLTAQWQDVAAAFRPPGSVGCRLRLPMGRRHPRQGPSGLGEAVTVGGDRVRADGRKELVAITDDYRESTESRADLLRDCRRRRMTAPVLAVEDGALGLGKAVREVLPRPAGSGVGFSCKPMCLLHFSSRRIHRRRRRSRTSTTPRTSIRSRSRRKPSRSTSAPSTPRRSPSHR